MEIDNSENISNKIKEQIDQLLNIYNVKTTISFIAEKITDELETLISINQPKLPMEVKE